MNKSTCVLHFVILFRSLHAQLEEGLEAEIRGMVLQVSLILFLPVFDCFDCFYRFACFYCFACSYFLFRHFLFFFWTLFTLFTVWIVLLFLLRVNDRWRSFEKASTDGFSFLGNPCLPKFLLVLFDSLSIRYISPWIVHCNQFSSEHFSRKMCFEKEGDRRRSRWKIQEFWSFDF